MHTPDLFKFFCKGKEKIVEFEVVSGSKPPEAEEAPIHFEIVESVSEVEVLKKSLQYFKDKNKYLIDSNEKLMIANRRL